MGRITEVGQKRWKVDVNSKQEGVLQLASINLPGGVQVCFLIYICYQWCFNEISTEKAYSIRRIAHARILQ